MTILLIDDEADVRRLAGLALSRIGQLTVIEAAGGREGIDLALREQPDAILLDVMMPDLDGPSTLELLRDDPRTAGIPVIFISAAATKNASERLERLGTAGVITKPFAAKTLAADVERLIAAWHERPADSSADPNDTGAGRLMSQGEITDYQKRLRTQVAEARRLIDQLLRSGGLGALTDLAALAHKIHGSAALYGFLEAGAAARRIEADVEELGGAERPDLVDMSRLGTRVDDLARAVDEHSALADLAMAPSPLTTGKKVLLIDDDPECVVPLRATFTRLDMSCTVATDVDIAIAMFQGDRFDLVVADHRLPSGTSRDVVRVVRELDTEIPILLISGNIDRQDLQQMVGESIDQFLEKPLEMPTFTASIPRLLALGDERTRHRTRAASLLALSSLVRVDMPRVQQLSVLAAAVGETTAFRSAQILLPRPDGTLELAISHGSWEDDPGLTTIAAARRHHQAGFRLGSSSWIPKALDVVVQPPEGSRRFSQARSRRSQSSPGDLAMTELEYGESGPGFLIASDPSDARPPTEDSMRMLSLVGQQIANTLENEVNFQNQLHLSHQLELVGEIVKHALTATELEPLFQIMTDAAVEHLGASFACFLDGETIVVPAGTSPSESLELTAEGRQCLSQARSTDEATLIDGREGCGSLFALAPARTTLAIPVLHGSYDLIVETEDGSRHGAVDLEAYTLLADQITLVWNRILDHKYLQEASAELRQTHKELEKTHRRNLELQEVLRRYVPESTWQAASERPLERIEAIRDVAVMFVDIVGFTALSETATADDIVELLDAYFSLSSKIIARRAGEVIKYIGDGIMSHFPTGADAVRAADELLRSEAQLRQLLVGTDLPPIEIRIGVAFGPSVLANVGPAHFRDRTLLGDTVNMASRLEKLARKGTALFDARVLDQASLESLELVQLPAQRVRGRDTPVAVLTFARDRHKYETDEPPESTTDAP